MQTEKVYELNGCKLVVVFATQLVSIKEPKALKKYLSKDIDARSTVFVSQIKQDYLNFIGESLSITNDSMVIEIWGHVYASHLAKAARNLVQLQLIESFADFVIKRSDTIECGESEIDSNRVFWDVLANFKGIILNFLPKRLK
ncbi:hypothetical protein [Pedobacter sp. Hv1]|uniref:hypothetical protein n=1 Tax=Pedobacter sp. Hv1 TaxID=1740090 RepID=UPI0006D8CA82|nr:hypothetical protein [Pedobacter sp. Hv1]KQC01449.1 hypothetical protein AQF98_07005 [Pedobacter sp. Hv1]